MSEEHAKPSSSSSSSSPPEQPPSIPDHVHPSGLIQQPQHPSMYPLPPSALPPVHFSPPHPEGIGSHGDANGTYQLPFPPMMYVYPPPPPPGQPGSNFPHGPTMLSTLPAAKPKRKQVKMACTNCASACKKCDDGRPCQRCIRSNLTATCKNGVRKERKKGLKRGPYKRKNKNSEDDHESEIAPHVAPPIPYPVMQFPEGYIPFFLPPPPPGYFQGEPSTGPPPQIPLYHYPHFTPFSYPGGIPIPYPMMPFPPPPGVFFQDTEHTAYGVSRGQKRNRAESDLDTTAKKTKIGIEETNGSNVDGEMVDNHSAPSHDSVSSSSSHGTPEQV